MLSSSNLLFTMTISFIITLLIYLLRNPFKIIYIDIIRPLIYFIKYKDYCDYYCEAYIKNFNICKFHVKRNYKIKLYIPSRNIFTEGKIIGLDRYGLLYIKDPSGNVIIYEKRAITPNDIIYIKK